MVNGFFPAALKAEVFAGLDPAKWPILPGRQPANFI